MKAELITIGDEILIGQIVDTNSAWIANELSLLGIDIVKITSISDNKKEIFKAIDYINNDTDIIIMTGGLGPTNDDITKESLAEYFNVKLTQNKEVLEHIQNLLQGKNVKLNARNIRQADIPENCKIIPNNIGTAPGMLFSYNKKILISIPGVPYEMKKMMTEQILPFVITKMDDNVIVHKNIITQGVPESALAEMLEDWENSLPSTLSLAYLPSPGIVKLRLTARGNNVDSLHMLINSQIGTLKRTIPELICGYDSETLEETVGTLLKEKCKTLSLAESCTGGNIAKMITSIPGSSEYFLGGIVAYANEIKKRVLNVNERYLVKYGAVSKQVVEDMAKNTRELYKSDYAIATSGIAGPDGGTEEKPVGTVWIAVAGKSNLVSKKFIYGNNRERNIQRASVSALNMLQKCILNEDI